MCTAIYLAGTVLASAVSFFIGSYSKEKGKNAALKQDISKLAHLTQKAKNAATKEDIEEITDKVEKIKSELVLAVNKRSRLFDIRVESIKELYILAQKLHASLSKTIIRFIPKGMKTEEYDNFLNKEIDNSLEELNSYYVSNCIFLTPILDQQINKLIKDAKDLSLDIYEVNAYNTIGVVDRKLLDKSNLKRMETTKKLQNEIPNLLEEMKNTMIDIIDGKEY